MASAGPRLSPHEIRRLLKSGESCDFQILYRFAAPQLPEEFWPELFQNLDKVPLKDRILFLNRMFQIRDKRFLRHLVPFLADTEPLVRELATRQLSILLFLPLLPSWGLPNYENDPSEAKYIELKILAAEFLEALTPLWQEVKVQPAARQRLLESLAHFREIGHLLNPLFREFGTDADLRCYTDLCAARERSDYPDQLILALTYGCQLDCAYCFSRNRATEAMSGETFTRILAWMKHTDCRRISFTGGEPTVHPHFARFMQQCRDQGLGVYFNSNGLFGRRIMNALSPDFILSLGIHYTKECHYRKGQKSSLLETLESLKKKAIPTFLRINIDSLEDNHWLEAIRLCETHEIMHLNLALAFPAEHGLNRHVARVDIHKYGDRIAEILRECAYRHISVALAKPIPICLFPLEVWRDMVPHHDLFHSCSIHKNDCTHNVVVDPDGGVLPCMAIQRWKKSLFDFADRREMGLHFRPLLESMMKIPYSQDCDHCLLHFEKKCQGLCLAYRLRESPGYENQIR